MNFRGVRRVYRGIKISRHFKAFYKVSEGLKGVLRGSTGLRVSLWEVSDAFHGVAGVLEGVSGECNYGFKKVKDDSRRTNAFQRILGGFMGDLKNFTVFKVNFSTV